LESLDGIYERMRGAYAQASGWEPDAVSDTGLKLRVLAGELYRFGARLEWLERQAFPQTADGEGLDMHGAQRGVARRGSRKAQGVLAFSRYIPISFDLVIPKGTLCASSGEEAVEYETTEEGILAAGEVTVSVPPMPSTSRATATASSAPMIPSPATRPWPWSGRASPWPRLCPERRGRAL